MAPTPASPTSLLWAHQLKREHAFLLARIKAVEDKNMAAEQRNEALHNRVEATEKKLNEHMQEVEVNEKGNKRANDKAIEEEQSRRDREVNRMDNKLDTLSSTLQELGARNERCIFTLYTALTTQACRQEDVSKQLKTLENGLTEVEGEVERTNKSVKKYSTGPKTLRKPVNNSKDHEIGNANDVVILENPLRKKNDAADAIVLARRVEALEAQRIEDNATINALRQRVFDLERAMTRLNHDSSGEVQAQMETKEETAQTPPPEKPLSQVTTEIQTTPSLLSQYGATMSSPLQEYTRREYVRNGRHFKKSKIIMPLLNENVAKATLKGPRAAQGVPTKIQPNATRKRKALAPVPPCIRETRSKARLSRYATEQQTLLTNELLKDQDNGPVCKDSQPSRDRKRAKEMQPAQEGNKKRRQILQVCELEEPD